MATDKTRIATAYYQLTGKRLKGRIGGIESISIEDMAPALYATVRTTEGTYKAACVYGRPFIAPQWSIRQVVPVDEETMMAWEQYEIDSYL